MVKVLAEVTGSIAFSQRGEKGESGDTPYVTKTVVDYAITSSVSEAKKWTSTAPDASAAANKGKFLWTRTTYTWSNNKTTENITYTYIGKDGKDGTSVSITGEATAIYANCAELQAALDDNPTIFIPGDNPVLLNTSLDADRLKGQHGSGHSSPTVVSLSVQSGNVLYYNLQASEKGECYIYNGDIYNNTGAIWYKLGKIQGPQGEPGKDGVDAVQYYYHIAWCNTPDNSDKSFTTSCSDDAQYAYMGVCYTTKEKDPEDFSAYEWNKVKGATGDTGNGIESTEVTYQIGSSGTIPPTGTWSTSVQNITDANPYLWTRTIFKYTNGGSSEPSYSVATRGTKGALMRQHEGFESDEYKYLSGSGAEAYIDVVYINNKWWQCIVTYDDKTSTPSLDDGHWEVMNNYKSIATHLLLAENATINMLGTNQINLFNPTDTTTDSKMYGSFRVVKDVNDWSLWLGGETGDSASFAVTRGGAIKATAGRIGSFVITERKDPTGFVFYSLYATHNSFGIIPACDVELGYTGIHVWSGNNTATNFMDVSLGHNGESVEGSPTWGNGTLLISGNTSGGGDSDVTAINVSVTPKEGYRCYALSAYQGDVLLQNGSFIGALRPNVTTKYDSSTLSENECYIICTNSSTITLTLPSNPRKGQLYFVYQSYARINISSTSSRPIVVLGHDRPYGTTTFTSNTRNQLSILIYGGDGYWYCNHMNG